MTSWANGLYRVNAVDKLLLLLVDDDDDDEALAMAATGTALTDATM
jgi:hypothetical protein